MRFAGRPNLKSLADRGALRPSTTSRKIEDPYARRRTVYPRASVRSHIRNFTVRSSRPIHSQLKSSTVRLRRQRILNGRDTVLDAYCGMGTIGQYLARFCEKVVGIRIASVGYR